jgi:hypothetical protein
MNIAHVAPLSGANRLHFDKSVWLSGSPAAANKKKSFLIAASEAQGNIRRFTSHKLFTPRFAFIELLY